MSTTADITTTPATTSDSTPDSTTSTASTGTGATEQLPSLYERIGGRAGLERIVPDVVRLHLENPIVGERFRAAKKSVPELVSLAVDFFATGLSGEPTYTGLSMPDAHRGMNVTEADYLAVLDDILAALQLHEVGAQEQAELLFIAYGMKSEIIGR